MQTKGNSLRGFYGILCIIMILLALGRWVQYRAHFAWKDVEEKGIISVAKVLHYETGEFSSALTLEVYLGDKKFTTTVDEDCDECVGNFYFVKVLKSDPQRYPLLYAEDTVPDCILSKLRFTEGWKDFPRCDSR